MFSFFQKLVGRDQYKDDADILYREFQSENERVIVFKARIRRSVPTNAHGHNPPAIFETTPIRPSKPLKSQGKQLIMRDIIPNSITLPIEDGVIEGDP